MLPAFTVCSLRERDGNSQLTSKGRALHSEIDERTNRTDGWAFSYFVCASVFSFLVNHLERRKLIGGAGYKICVVFSL
jgi:hypothetical protein